MDWNEIILGEQKKPYYESLANHMREEYATQTCYPVKENVFNAFHQTPYDKVKVVILGQDPYHEPGQAQGLSFHVNNGVKIPPSLVNIFKELDKEYGKTVEHPSGNLLSWTHQGVLLLNSVLTVRAHQAGSHAGLGWETFTDNILTILGKEDRPIVFMLWGKYANGKASLLGNNPNHLILQATHPSPFSASRSSSGGKIHSFFGCNHFVDCNNFLMGHGVEGIDWYRQER